MHAPQLRPRTPACTLARTAACAATAVAAVAAGAVALAPTPAGATLVRPIQPHQSFVGATKGPMGTDTVLMICPGAARSGHPASGQYVVVHRATTAAHGGSTGARGDRIAVSWPAPPPSAAAPLVIGAYDVDVAIPTSLTLPCGVKAIVRFTPVPTSRTARPDLVEVAFDPGPAAQG